MFGKFPSHFGSSGPSDGGGAAGPMGGGNGRIRWHRSLHSHCTARARYERGPTLGDRIAQHRRCDCHSIQSSVTLSLSPCHAGRPCLLAGMKVVVGDLHPATAEAPLPGGVVYIPTDVTRPEDLERLADACGGEPPAVWCNNAGIAVEVGRDIVVRTQSKKWRAVVDINFKAVLEGSQIAIHRNLEAREAAERFSAAEPPPCFIVNTASASGLTPRQASVYSASKAGVIHFGRGVAEGLRLDKVGGVFIYSLCPTFTETPMMTASMPETLIAKSRARGILAGPEVISDGMLHLIDHSDEIENGAVMRFDTKDGESVAALVALPESVELPVMTSKM
jgi:NAD(P)-dependent dehydrogenase (short-subunit alcohol dehydrogenase family)